MKRPARFLAPIAIAALVLAACGDGDDAPETPAPDDAEEAVDDEVVDEGDEEEDAADEDREPVTVTMWFNGTPEAHGAVLEQLIPEFEDENPHITVDWELTAWDTYQQQIATAAAGGTLPDIIFGFSNLVAGFAERGILADHSEFFDPDDFVPATVDLTTWDDTWSMLPIWFSASTLSYRQDLIEEGGIGDASSGPDSWDEWQEWAEAATIRENGSIEQLGFYSSSFGFNQSGLYGTLLYANGGQLVSDDGSEVAFDSPEGIEAARFFQELSECCDQPGALEADNIGLGQGRTAMVFNNFAFREWADEFPELLEEEVDRLTIVPTGPSGSGDLGTTLLGANVIGITSTADHPEEAAELLRFLVLDPDNVVQLAGLGGSIPAAVATEGQAYFDENPLVERYFELAVDFGRADPAHPNFGEYDSIMQSWIEELLVGAITPEEFVESAAAEVQEEIIDRSGTPFFVAGG